jgi:hypothetical protein
MAKFLGDRVNSLLESPTYINLGVYGLHKSLRLFDCPDVSPQGLVDHTNRYTLPRGANPLLYMITNTLDCVHLQTPLHIRDDFPIDPVYHVEYARITDDHMNAV